MDTAGRLRVAVEQRDRSAATVILNSATPADLAVITIDGIPMADIMQNLSASVEELVELLVPEPGNAPPTMAPMAMQQTRSASDAQDADVIRHMLEGASWQESFDSGIAALAEGRYTDAVGDFSEAIALRPRYAEAYAERGWAYYRAEDYQQAFNDCCESIRIDPCVAKGYYGRALVRMVNENCDECIADCNAAIRIQPDIPDPHCLRGSARLVQSRNLDDRAKRTLFAQAIMDFTEAIRLRPDYAEAYYNRGLAYGEIGNMKSAIADFSEAMQLDPSIEKMYEKNRSKLSATAATAMQSTQSTTESSSTPRAFTIPGEATSISASRFS